MKIEVHSKTSCPFCVKAKEYLKTNEILFDEIVHDDTVDRNNMYDAFGLKDGERTVPQIVVDGVRLGGYTALVNSDLVQVYHSGSFDTDF